MHAGKLESSKRLQLVYGILADHQPHSTWELAQATQSCAISTDVSALRHNGVTINCKQVGRGRYEYTIPERVYPETNAAGLSPSGYSPGIQDRVAFRLEQQGVTA